MSEYRCDICNYTTTINSNYHKHLRTSKHKKKEEKYKNSEKPILSKNESKIFNYNIHKEYVCKTCNKSYSTKAHLNRHMKHYCKDHTQDQLLNIIEKQNKTIEEMHAQHQKEKHLLFTKMDKLLDHVGDTTNNITNNKIILNCYGQEDYSHITNAFKNMLIKLPYSMVPKFIEELHFSKPENKNICLPNKKEQFIKVFTDNKWIYKDRKSTIEELIDKNISFLDNYFLQEGKENLDNTQQKRYVEFHEKIHEKSSDTKESVKKQTELVLLNNEIK